MSTSMLRSAALTTVSKLSLKLHLMVVLLSANMELMKSFLIMKVKKDMHKVVKSDFIKVNLKKIQSLFQLKN